MSCNNRPPFDRPFRRETAPPRSSARLVSAHGSSHDVDEETNGEMLTYPSFYLVRNHSCLPSSKRRTYARLFYLKTKDVYRILEENLQMFPRQTIFSCDTIFCEYDFLRISRNCSSENELKFISSSFYFWEEKKIQLYLNLNLSFSLDKIKVHVYKWISNNGWLIFFHLH